MNLGVEQIPLPKTYREWGRPIRTTESGGKARRSLGFPLGVPGPLWSGQVRIWSSRSLAAPGAATPKGGGGGPPLPGLPRLPGDDNFPATGSSWPGSRRAPAPGLPALATPSRRAGGGAHSAPREGQQTAWGSGTGWGDKIGGKGPGRGHLPGPRGWPLRLAPVPPGPACAPRRRPRPLRAPSGWGWGWGEAPSPDCPGRRRPSSSCPRARAHPAGSAGPPWRCARRGRGRCPPAALPANHPRAVRVRRLPRSLARPPPRPAPPRRGQTRPRWRSRQAGRQGPLRSCRAPLSPPRAADLRLRGPGPGPPPHPAARPALGGPETPLAPGPRAPCPLGLDQLGRRTLESRALGVEGKAE